MQLNLSPISTNNPDRIILLDVIRGIAILGILLMNIPFFGMAHTAVFDLRILDETTGPNFMAWQITSLFFEGSMRGLFSILFGAGALLLIFRLEKRTEGNSSAHIYYKRLLWLIIFGIIHQYLFL
ncbi:MAG: hypothetical protein M3421_00135 [Bacteroidota bacterium]|nr:hypothetical protein [Bacteroidota bacterium]